MTVEYDSPPTDTTLSHEKDRIPQKEDSPTGVVQMRVDGRGDDIEMSDPAEEVDGVFGAGGSGKGQVNYRRCV